MIFQELKRKFLARMKVYRFGKHLQKTKKDILQYFHENPSSDREIQAAVAYLKQHPLRVFNAPFREKYSAEAVEVQYENGLPYVNSPWGKLFFKRAQNPATIKLLYNGLIMEQDPASPHRYTNADFQITQGDVLADIGSAEGIFTLMNIELLEKAYLFEQDEQWIEALEATFAPWKEKVIIIPKYVSDRQSEKEIRLDQYFQNTTLQPNFFKIDVEGAEEKVLNGMQGLAAQSKCKVALTTYHQQGDFEKFSRYFQERNYTHSGSDGVMVFINSFHTLEPPYFRKGLIRAVSNPS
jgi:hypothetical protein